MSDSQAKQYVEVIELSAKKYLASKKSALASLRAAGIIDAHGKLTAHYRSHGGRTSHVHTTPKPRATFHFRNDCF
jgi:hypothetical protein